MFLLTQHMATYAAITLLIPASLGVGPKGRIPGFHFTSIAQQIPIKFHSQDIQLHKQSWFIFAEILRLLNMDMYPQLKNDSIPVSILCSEWNNVR